jgi:hypothetical protein
MTMPAGKYYIGDLCYVLHDSWDEFCDITISDHNCLHGEFNFKDGRRFATYGTKWGDGSYEDQFAREYAVDAGLIGCISVTDIDEELKMMTEELGPRFGGQIHVFDRPFDCYEKDGKIHIGDIVIDTDPSYEDLKEDYAEGDEY